MKLIVQSRTVMSVNAEFKLHGLDLYYNRVLDGMTYHQHSYQSSLQGPN